MRKILIIAALLGLTPLTEAQAQQPDAVYKLLRHEWTVNSDGTSDYHYRHEIKILRNRALTAYADKGETFVVYNPDIEELTVNEVYTLRADGSRVDMPQNAFVYQLPSQCADCGRFNHLRELAMVHTGMELGCTIVVDYTLHRQHNLVYNDIPLLRECPVERLEIKVNHPAEMEVQYRLMGEDYLPQGVTKEAVTRDNITLNGLPQTPNEPYMPRDIVPILHIYNGAPEYEPALTKEDFAGASDAMGQVMVGNTRENIVAARDFVIDNIHLNDIDPIHLGYLRATPAEVWATGCGTATEKAALLAAILNHGGYAAHVTGEDWTTVGVMVDTLEYRLDIRHKTPMLLAGEAKDEVKSTNDTRTLDAAPYLDTLENGFHTLRAFQPIAGEPTVNAGRLALRRATPLATQACDLACDHTYTLPKGLKMVGNPIAIKLSHEGVGSVEISVKQSGKKLRVVRKLKLEKSLVPVEEYAQYRELLAAWQSYNANSTVLLRKK